MATLVRFVGILALIAGAVSIAGYFYNRQVVSRALANAEITVGPYKFRPTPIKSDSTRDVLLAQLPGPAADGWYVIIGQTPGTYADNLEAVCMAFISTADAADGPHWEGINDKFEPQKKFKFNSIEEARNALRSAGWNNSSSSVWFASSGCDIDQSKFQRRFEPPPPTRRVPLQASPLAAGLTASEIEGVREKLRPCWSSFGGAQNAPTVILVVKMNQDGTPLNAEIKETGRYNRDPIYRAAADSAYRAIMNPRCHPWPLPAEKYNSWRTITLNLDPRG